MADLRRQTFAEFLSQQSLNFRSRLPLVHSSESSNLNNILTDWKISVTRCDTFTKDDLAYFFHGKPSYRKRHEFPKHWQLPSVLILKSACLVDYRRVFPFDSGAFFSSRLPQYLTDFGIDGYELSQVPNAIDLTVEMFFGSDDDYMRGQAKSVDEVINRAKLGTRHVEVHALCSMLNGEQVIGDDRTRVIELQADKDVMINDQLIGIVMPRPYFNEKDIQQELKKKNVMMAYYEVYNISVESYMANIYSEVLKIYQRANLIDV